MSEKKLKSFRLTEFQSDLLKQIGEGNATQGIINLIEWYQEDTEYYNSHKLLLEDDYE